VEVTHLRLNVARPAQCYCELAREIRLGIENMPAGKLRANPEKWLETGLPIWFASNPLPVNPAVAD
jgi:hypothetical protein